MKIALYKRTLEEEYLPRWQSLTDTLLRAGAEVVPADGDLDATRPDILLSVGGDGTLLSAVHLLGNRRIPVVGLNFGHLGFLTSAEPQNLDDFVYHLLQRHYTIEDRTLLDVRCHPAEGDPIATYALNEIYVHRSQEPSLLTTALYIDQEWVADYVADGLIVTTPTGSTAYSLSCGGPILAPSSHCFGITPIAAHTLTLRPIIVPDSVTLRLVPHGRQPHYRLGVDSRSFILSGGTPVELRLAPFTVKLLRMQGQSFYTAIHEKLSWGK